MSHRSPKKNLVYFIAFDAPESEGYRFLGKMLASSLLRTFFSGDVLVFRNSPAPLFLVERKGLEEVYLETPPMHGQAGAEEAWCWKYRVAELIENPEQYDKILFLDCDCLALRNIDHLLEGDWDICYQTERGKPMTGKSFHGFFSEAEMATLSNPPSGIPAHQLEGANSGTMAIRGAIFHEVMERWREIDESDMPSPESGFRDQASWNALLMRHTTKGSFQGSEFSLQKESANGADRPASQTEILNLKSSNSPPPTAAPPKWRAQPFAPGEVQFPGYLDPQFSQYREAAITHNIMPDTLQKIEFTFGLYMRTFFCDPTGMFFSMIEM
jgi:hypothetical protein